MKKIIFILAFLTAVFINLNAQNTAATDVFRQEGIASWYGKEFEGRPTANGEIFDPSKLTCAHPSLPFGTMLVVTNQHNNKSVTVRVNDRGPFVAARIIDVSRAAAEQLDMIITGTAPVKIESIDKIAISSSIQAAPKTTPQATAAQTAPVVLQPIAAPIQQIVNNSSVICTLTPAFIPAPEKRYRLQVGSYKNAHNAVSAFDKLRNAGLNPSYERYLPDGTNEYFRVVLAGVQGTDIQIIAEKLGLAGFKEALIKEEN